MLFNSYEFLLFFPGVFLAYFACPFRWRWLFLLIASYFFYMCWRWQYAFLIAGQTLVNFYAGLWMGRTNSPARKRVLLILALCASLGTLFFFKYYGFAKQSADSLLRLAGLDIRLASLEFILPVGISFYTFQTLSYTIDVFRGKMQVEPHLGRFALYVAFFPQLVAGPIERAQNLLVQFRTEHRLDLERVVSGLQLILWGLFKKVVIADRLAVYVNRVYGDPEAFSGPSLWLATYFFAFQIYCDFSGYSDIAIGCARMMGYNLMQNFRLPYLAKGIGDFWSRWHISLSSWFRDYLYIPLGGNRVSAPRWIFNIFLVFTVSGLWHGANWTFIVWGALHGLYYLLEYVLKPATDRVRSVLGERIAGALGILATFHLVLISWVFFRAASLSEAGLILSRMATDWSGILYKGSSQLTTALSLALIALLVIVQMLQKSGKVSLYFSKTAWPVPVRWACYLFLFFSVMVLGMSSNAFIYFQF